MRTLAMTMVVGLLAVAACDRRADRADAAAPDTTDVAESAEVVTDLLAPVRAVGLVAIEQGQTAMQYSRRESVRAYAGTVATDHRALVATLDSAAGTHGATLAETPEARELANAARMAHAGLENLPDTDYDLAFIRAQVEANRQLLDTIDQELYPAATSRGLQDLLRDVRGMVDAHLMRSRQLLGDLLGEPVEPPPTGGTAPVPSPEPSPEPTPEPTPPAAPDTVPGG
jgi:predicted outer membrane protein